MENKSALKIPYIIKKIAATAALLLVIAAITATAAFSASTSAINSANALYTLGIFQGTGTNSDGTPIYELDRTPTRQEAVTMLVRLLGEEDAALSGDWETPFEDLTLWAEPYVGYAYKKGLTDGVSSTAFGSTEPITAAQYITFVLRALGYVSDSDFLWSNSYAFSDMLGITNGEYSDPALQFTRGDVAVISFRALSADMKNSSLTLADTLLSKGAVTQSSLVSVGLSSEMQTTTNSRLTAEEIYKKCSPAVFYIETYTSEGEIISSGSGFFIDSSGTAVTNYHVIEYASSAEITLAGTDIKYEVSGVYRYSEDEDWAIIEVSGSGFPYLDLYNGEVYAGATVYAIGNPMGLMNSISEGIISYTSRVVDNRRYIQTSAAISYGSSGGALINTYGRVIGITSATIIDGQNLNLSVPISLVNTDTSGGSVPLSSIIPVVTVRVTHAGEGLSSLILGFGESVILDVTHDASNYGIILTKKVSDDSVISSYWGSWDDEHTAKLNITGTRLGTSVVSIYLSSAKGMLLAYSEFTVRVM